MTTARMGETDPYQCDREIDIGSVRPMQLGQAKRMIAPPSGVGVEELVVNLVLWLKLAVEAMGAVVIGVGMFLAGHRLVRAFPPTVTDFIDVRLTLARFLAIALEFQLGADILSTAVAPSWDGIGKLASIAVIRTALNYFLSREMEEYTPGSRALPANSRESVSPHSPN
jgi:uncharacterized membrane protein